MTPGGSVDSPELGVPCRTCLAPEGEPCRDYAQALQYTPDSPRKRVFPPLDGYHVSRTRDAMRKDGRTPPE